MRGYRNQVVRHATGLAMFATAAICTATGNAIAGDSKTVAEVAAMDNQDRAVFVSKVAGERKLFLGSRNGVKVADCLAAIFEKSEAIPGELKISRGVVLGSQAILKTAEQPDRAGQSAAQLIKDFVDYVAKQHCDPNLVTGKPQN